MSIFISSDQNFLQNKACNSNIRNKNSININSYKHPDSWALIVTPTKPKQEHLPIHGRRHNVAIIKRNSGDLQPVALQSLHTLSGPQVPHQDLRVDAAGDDPTTWQLLIGRNPRNWAHEAGVAEQNLGRRVAPRVGGVRRPQPHRPVPRRRGDPDIVANANPSNLERSEKYKNWKNWNRFEPIHFWFLGNGSIRWGFCEGFSSEMYR